SARQVAARPSTRNALEPGRTPDRRRPGCTSARLRARLGVDRRHARPSRPFRHRRRRRPRRPARRHRARLGADRTLRRPGRAPPGLLVYPLAAAAGLVAASPLTRAVERGEELEAEPLPPLHRSRGIVMRLSALFALDSFGGGFVPQTFIAYLFVRKYGASPHTLAIVFFAIGILQAISFQAAVRLAGRIGLLRTMVFTHLPSNLLLAAVAFSPNLASAIALLLARSLL